MRFLEKGKAQKTGSFNMFLSSSIGINNNFKMNLRALTRVKPFLAAGIPKQIKYSSMQAVLNILMLLSYKYMIL